METWFLLGCGFGAGLLIALAGIWNLRQQAVAPEQEDVADADKACASRLP
jgi:hypothetical protein